MSSMVSMPESVRVGPHVYSVTRKPASVMKDNNGWCDFDNLEIQIRERLRRSKAQEILLHEILHACTYPSFNGDTKMTDEDFVTAVSPLLVQVLQDNPRLVKYLTDGR